MTVLPLSIPQLPLIRAGAQQGSKTGPPQQLVDGVGEAEPPGGTGPTGLSGALWCLLLVPALAPAPTCEQIPQALGILHKAGTSLSSAQAAAQRIPVKATGNPVSGEGM